MPQPAEPRNPFYFILLAISLVFVLTVLAYIFVPILEQMLEEAGQPVPPSPFSKALEKNGWKWLLYEVAAMVVAGLLSMGLDRWRRYRQENISAKPPSEQH